LRSPAARAKAALGFLRGRLPSDRVTQRPAGASRIAIGLAAVLICGAGCAQLIGLDSYRDGPEAGTGASSDGGEPFDGGGQSFEAASPLAEDSDLGESGNGEGDAGALANDASRDGPPRCGSVVLTPVGAVSLSAMQPAIYAVDGNLKTRWESIHGVDPQWIYADFGAPVFMNHVQILWENSCGRDYDLQVSSDAATWTTITSVVGNTLGKVGFPTDWSTAADHPGLSGVGRYMRVYGKVRCNAYGYSIWEMRVFGDTNASCTP
jgi:hypothetical protein